MRARSRRVVVIRVWGHLARSCRVVRMGAITVHGRRYALQRMELALQRQIVVINLRIDVEQVGLLQFVLQLTHVGYLLRKETISNVSFFLFIANLETGGCEHSSWMCETYSAA